LNSVTRNPSWKQTLVPQIPFKKKVLFFILNSILFCFRIFPVKQKKVLFWSKNLKFQDNAKALFLYWQKKKGFEHLWLMDRKNGNPAVDLAGFKRTKAVFLNSPTVFYHLSTAKYWIREIEVASPGLQPRRKTIVVQLWHAAGAFKKFGLDLENRSDDLKKYRLKDARRWDLLLCSSEKVSQIYQHAFGKIDKKKIFVTGLPRNDFLFHCQKRKDRIRSQLNIPLDTKLVLYAPTFRDNGLNPDMVVDIITFLDTSLPRNYILGVRLHPAIVNKIELKDNILNLSLYDTEPVLSVSDILITDYSSIVFDFVLLERPMLFYSPDVNEYGDQRGFYFDYSTFIPGPLCKTKESLLDEIVNYEIERWEKVIKNFKQDFQPDFDGENSKRVFERIIQIEK